MKTMAYAARLQGKEARSTPDLLMLTETNVFRKILVPTDGSPLSDKAANAAVEFARIYGASVVALSVAEPYPFSPLSETAFTDERKLYEQKARELADQRAERIAAVARTGGVQCEAVVSQSFAPHDEIIKVAQEHDCDAIFMATHGRKGLSRIFIGSETQKVLTNSSIPVMVFR
jgi:nucleotide-binding universal stress UspA family protein